MSRRAEYSKFTNGRGQLPDKGSLSKEELMQNYRNTLPDGLTRAEKEALEQAIKEIDGQK